MAAARRRCVVCRGVRMVVVVTVMVVVIVMVL
jgi:hypothetical protein